MNGSLAEILESPLLVEFSDQIVRKLDAERAARGRFRERADVGLREEFVNGEVVEQVSNQDQHSVALDNLHGLVATFVRARKLGAVRREQALTAFPRNDYCPDLCFWEPRHGIGSQPNQTVYPPPDFVVEVLSPSTERRDRGVKFEDYESHGVREYWIVDPARRTLEQYVARDGRYAKVFDGATGVVRSVVIAGLEVPAEAAFDEELQLATLQQFLKSS